MVPVVDVDLADGDSVFCTHDKLLWHDGTVKLSTKKSGFFKSRRSGMPVTLMAATGPGRIAFSDNHAGELVAMPLDAGDVLVGRQHHMLLATGNVDYDGHNINLWYQTKSGDDTETEYPVGNFERFWSRAASPASCSCMPPATCSSASWGPARRSISPRTHCSHGVER